MVNGTSKNTVPVYSFWQTVKKAFWRLIIWIGPQVLLWLALVKPSWAELTLGAAISIIIHGIVDYAKHKA